MMQIRLYDVRGSYLLSLKGSIKLARMVCKCGKILSTIQVPNDIELIVYTDFEWDKIINMDIQAPLDIPEPEKEVWRCPKCDRIYVFEGNKIVKRYILEE